MYGVTKTLWFSERVYWECEVTFTLSGIEGRETYCLESCNAGPAQFHAGMAFQSELAAEIAPYYFGTTDTLPTYQIKSVRCVPLVRFEGADE